MVKVSQGGQLRLSVSNKGVKVLLGESRKILDRGVRGLAAQRFRGEGSGIGLFLVDKITEAHNGAFRIFPTDSEGDTVAELLIPPDSV